MDLKLARQPILDRHENTFGYELFYRESDLNEYISKDGDKASSRVIAGAFLNTGLDVLTGGRKAFINFTRDLLTEEVATLFPKEQIVVEILEDVVLDEEIIASIVSLREKGYTLALDDFVFVPGLEKVLELIDIVKIDFLNSTEEYQAKVLEILAPHGIEFLAEKVETKSDFERALRLGYDYFQGYFFAKPSIYTSAAPAPSQLHYLRLINLVNDENPDFRKIAEVIETDVTFSYEILRLANCAGHTKPNRIKSIGHAITYLGLQELKKWIYITIVRDFAEQTGTKEPSMISVIRARVMEQLALESNRKNFASETFTLGMLSLLDVVTGREKTAVLNEINISSEIKNILLDNGSKSFMNDIYQGILFYERGKWDKAYKALEIYGISLSDMNRIYRQALEWFYMIERAVAFY